MTDDEVVGNDGGEFSHGFGKEEKKGLVMELCMYEETKFGYCIG